MKRKTVHRRVPAVFELPEGQLGKQRPIQITVVGCGGTGSQLLTGLTFLHHALHAHGFKALRVTAYDPDAVGESNVVRQRFAVQDVGHNKASRLIGRFNTALGLQWRAMPCRFGAGDDRETPDLLISCVDTRRARHEVKEALCHGQLSRTPFWLDTGNGRTHGHAILGQVRNAVNRAPQLCAPDLVLPDLTDLSLPEDDAPSCSALESLTRQDLYVNAKVANEALNLIWRLIHDRRLEWHGVLFNMQSGEQNVLRVQEAPASTRKRQSA